MASPPRPSLSVAKLLLFSTLPTVALLVTAEFVLRISGAAERCPGYKSSILWVCDPILYFKPNPGQAIDGRRLINRAGFRSREFEPKRAGVYRVLALGDSCTFGVIAAGAENHLQYVAEPYPQRLDRLTSERLGPGHVEVLNAGVAGYNSYQGIMLLRTKLRGMQPDLITVRFGWNDHLMSAERSIGNAFHEPATWLGLATQDLLLHTAIYPFSQRVGMEVRLRWQPGAAEKSQLPSTWTPNIPLAEYAHNLERIVQLGRAQGAAVWLLTAPHAFLAEPRPRDDAYPASSSAGQMLIFNAIPSFDRLVEIHEAYNAATRETGAKLGVPVIDMEAAYRTHAGEALFEAGDVLHPNQAGHDLEAEVLYERLLAERIKDSDTSLGHRADTHQEP